MKGVKLHPIYQGFQVLDERMMPVYQAAADAGLVLLFHSGDDIGFPGDHRCMPSTMMEVKRRVPALKMVLAHLGGFRQTADFERHCLGTGAHIEVSASIPDGPDETFTRVIRGHTPGHVMFGTDSPWDDQQVQIDRLKRSVEDAGLLEDILWNNAARLLEIEG